MQEKEWQNQFFAADHLTPPGATELLTHGRHVHWFCRNTLHCVIFLDNKEQQMDRKWLQIVVCKQPVLQRRSEVTWNRKELRQQWGFPGPPVDQWSWWKSIVEFKVRILSSVCDFRSLQSGGVKFVRFSTLWWLQLEGYRGKLLTGMLSASPESKRTKTTVTGFHWSCWLLRLTFPLASTLWRVWIRLLIAVDHSVLSL